jgi:hypothetical protein
VRNGYAAFAMDATSVWGTGWGHTSSIAVQYAQTGCRTVGGLTCNAIVQTYKTRYYKPALPTTGGIPDIPPLVTQALPPAATGLGVSGTGGPPTR